MGRLGTFLAECSADSRVFSFLSDLIFGLGVTKRDDIKDHPSLTGRL